MDEDVKIDLATVTTDELWEELKTRFKAAVLLSEREQPGDADSGDHLLGVWWHATAVEFCGLMEYGMSRAKRKMDALLDAYDSQDEDE